MLPTYAIGVMVPMRSTSIPTSELRRGEKQEAQDRQKIDASDADGREPFQTMFNVVRQFLLMVSVFIIILPS